MAGQRKPQVVVVTGASAGVGRAAARAFGQRGVKVALLARRETGLAAAEQEVRQAGGQALAVPTDMADAAAVEAAADRVEAELGLIDCWVNNAFSSVFAPFHEIGADEFRRVTEVTYLGYVNGTRAALNRMRPRHWGTIVQVGSALAYRGIPLQTAYCGAKHAIKGFTEALRTELIHDRTGVNVTMVHLPAVNTPQFDWLLSRLPKRKGYAAQQTDADRRPDRPANLWRPVDGADGVDYGSHGSFDERSRGSSLQWWATEHRGFVLAAAAATAGGALMAVRRLRR